MLAIIIFYFNLNRSYQTKIEMSVLHAQVHYFLIELCINWAALNIILRATRLEKGPYII